MSVLPRADLDTSGFGTTCSTAPTRGTVTDRCVVAVVLTWRGNVGLFKRSADVAHDRGRWHCLTGYVEAANQPWSQIIQELYEETGLSVADLNMLERGPALRLEDAAGNTWTVHTFRADTHRKRLRLNWEHDTYRWVAPGAVARFDGQVSWLGDVIAAVSTSGRSGSTFARSTGSAT